MDNLPQPRAASRATKLDPEQLALRLAVLPDAEPLAALQGLARLARDVPASRNAARSRLEMMECLQDPLQARLLEVDRVLEGADAPLPADIKAQVVTAYEALKRMGGGYAALAADLRRNGRSCQARHLALTRALQQFSRQLVLGYRAHAPGSGSTWPMLHRLHQACVEAGVADQPADATTESPDQIYTKALLLGLAEPEGFAPGELDRVRFYLYRHAHLARLSSAIEGLPDVSASAARFLIQRKRARPGRSLAKWRRASAEAGDQVLDCTELAARLQEQIAGLEQGKAASWLGLPAAARRPEYLPMLRSLHQLWSSPPLRRQARVSFRRPCQVICGIQALWHALGGTGGSGGEARSLSLAAVSSEWSLLNEGRDGYALRYVGGPTASAHVGELIGVRVDDDDPPRLCVVRRSRNDGADGLALGVQRLAPLAVALTVMVSVPSLELRPRPFPLRALFLPSVPALRGRAALLVAPNRIKSGFECTLEMGDARSAWKATGYVEAGATWELVMLEPLTLAAADGIRRTGTG